MRKRTSIIWSYPEPDFKKLILTSQTMSQVLKFFGMENKGGNYVTCKNRIKELNIDSSHFLNRLHSSILTKEVSKDEFLTRLVEHSPHKRVSTKKYLIKFNLLLINAQSAQMKDNGII